MQFSNLSWIHLSKAKKYNLSALGTLKYANVLNVKDVIRKQGKKLKFLQVKFLHSNQEKPLKKVLNNIFLHRADVKRARDCVLFFFNLNTAFKSVVIIRQVYSGRSVCCGAE